MSDYRTISDSRHTRLFDLLRQTGLAVEIGKRRAPSTSPAPAGRACPLLAYQHRALASLAPDPAGPA